MGVKTDYLVIGASGMLGSRLAEVLSARGSVAGTYCKRPVAGLHQCDLGSEASVRSLFTRVEPRVLIHAGGMTRPDDCENMPRRAYAVNVRGLRYLLKYFCGEHVVLFSTDYVFDGESAPYDERASTHPVNVYGTTKADAEKMLLDSSITSTVARVSGLYGWSHTNREFLLRLSSGSPILASAKHYSSYTWLDDICRLFPVVESVEGIVHIVGPGRYSRAEFLKIACHFLAPTVKVLPVDPAIAYPGARRPADTTMVSAILDLDCTPLSIALRELRSRLGQGDAVCEAEG